MRNRMKKPNDCRLAVGTVTEAIRAQELLSASGIRGEIVGADNHGGRREGCGYALSFPCALEGEVRRILRDAGLRRYG